MIVQKHSRLPRKSEPGEKRELSVAKHPMANLPEERRTEIANQVLERYMKGEQVAHMAPDYQTSDVTLYALLLRDHEEQWKEIQVARALARLERAQALIEEASDALSLARAREGVRSAQWELSTLKRRLYGQDQANLGITVTPNLTIITVGEQHVAPLSPPIEHTPDTNE